MENFTRAAAAGANKLTVLVLSHLIFTTKLNPKSIKHNKHEVREIK